MIWSQLKMYLLNMSYVDALYLIWLKSELLIACLAFLEVMLTLAEYICSLIFLIMLIFHINILGILTCRHIEHIGHAG